MNHTHILIYSISLFPFLSFLICMIFSKRFANRVAGIGTGLLFFSIISSFLFFYETWFLDKTYYLVLHWFKIKGKTFDVRIWIDNTSALLLMLVSIISFLVHLFSLDYMKKDKHYGRYFSLLGLFTFAMQSLLLTNNLLIIYIFWELVGFCSYLLIGFWYEKQTASHAAKKAFLINRVGDTGFLLAIVLVWFKYQTLDIQLLTNQSFDGNFIDIFIGLGFLLALCAKSAQLPLSVWLPSAMEGPTPVSALIHAATMVAAGIYLLIRVYFMLPIEIQILIVVIGSLTALFSAFSALSQTDMKKVLAYSTISQLGYMTVAIGIGATQVALFHLLTHAFFKAGLFLNAGTVIHYTHEQDMEKMGGLKKAMPLTFISYSICAFSLAGLPLFSGFLSKDLILSQLWLWSEENHWGWIVLITLFITSLITAIYIGRQWSMVFLRDTSRAYPDTFSNRHSSIITVALPLVILALGSLGIVFSWNPFVPEQSWVLNTQQYQSNHWVSVFASVLALAGLWIGWCFYSCREVSQNRIANWILKSSLYRFSYHFFYLDAFYTKLSRQLLAWTKAKVFNINALNNLHEVYLLDEIGYIGSESKKLEDKKLHKLFDWVIFGFVSVSLAQRLARFDRKGIDKIVDWTGIGLVTVGYICAWIDKIIIDGLVKTISLSMGKVGKLTRSIQNGKVQVYFAWAMIGLLVVIMLIIF